MRYRWRRSCSVRRTALPGALDGVLIDAPGVPKKGENSLGVAPQHPKEELGLDHFAGQS